MTISEETLSKRAGVAAGDDAMVEHVRRLAGGLSSATFAASLVRAGRQPEPIVIKVAPPGLAPVRHRDVLRQARLLRALAGVTDVAVPDVLFSDDGAPPDVPPFFAMSFVEGESFEPMNDDHPLPAADVLAERYLGAARMLAALHAVSPAMVGLGDEPEVNLVDEIARWERALDTVDDDLRTGHAACAEELRRNIPAPIATTVCHGDWRLGNMLCDGPRITGVIDWEIWSRGDPRVDLAWFLAVSGRDGNVFAIRDDVAGVPERGDLVDAYEEASGRTIGDLGWFGALIEYKQAATMGLIVKRNRRSERPDPVIEANAPRLPLLIEQAMERLSCRWDE